MAAIKFYGLPNAPASVPFPSGDVLPFPKGVSRKRAARVAGRIIGKSLVRAIPFAGAALTAWEIYDFFNAAQYPYINPAKWTLVQSCGGNGGGWAGSASLGTCGPIFQTGAPITSIDGVSGSYRFRYAAKMTSPYTGNRERGDWYTRTVPVVGGLPSIIARPDVNPALNPRWLTNPNIVPNPWHDPEFWPPIDPYPEANPSPAPAPAHAPQPAPSFPPAPVGVPMVTPRWEIVHTFTPPAPAPSPIARPDPVGRPNPVPAPRPRIDPRVNPIPNPSRPPKGTKEVKPGTNYLPQVLLDVASEGAEIVDCMYDAMPSVQLKAQARQKFGSEMASFWKDFQLAMQNGQLKTARDKAVFLSQKPKWDKSWKDPAKRKANWGDNSMRYGIDRADLKLKYMYDHFHELKDTSVIRQAIECVALDQQLDKAIAAGQGRTVVNNFQRRSRSRL